MTTFLLWLWLAFLVMYLWGALTFLPQVPRSAREGLNNVIGLTCLISNITAVLIFLASR